MRSRSRQVKCSGIGRERRFLCCYGAPLMFSEVCASRSSSRPSTRSCNVARTVRDVPALRRSRARRRRRVGRSHLSRGVARRPPRARGPAPPAQSRRRRRHRHRLPARARARRRRGGGDGRRRTDGPRRSAAPAAAARSTDSADYVKGNRFAARRRLARDAAGAPARQRRALAAPPKSPAAIWRLFDSQCGYTVASRRALAVIDADGLFPRYGYPNDLLARLQRRAPARRATCRCVRSMAPTGARGSACRR